MVKRIVLAQCCRRECLCKRLLTGALDVVTGCIHEVKGMNRKEKKEYLLEKIRSCVVTRHSSGYISFGWKLGVSPAPILNGVCRKAFMNAYRCSKGYIDSIVDSLKTGIRSFDKPCNDRLPRVNTQFISHLENLASWHGITLTRKQLQALTIPNTFASLNAFTWMGSYFEACGEQQPNGDEIHLDPCVVAHIWDEYKVVMDDADEVHHNYIYDVIAMLLTFSFR